MKILVINAGSSSLKVALYDSDNLQAATNKVLWKAELLIGSNNAAELTIEKLGHAPKTIQTDFVSYRHGLESILSHLVEGDMTVLVSFDEIDAIGHRIVHGGIKYSQSVIIDDQVLADLHEYIQLAPAHLPANIESIETSQLLLPKAIQIAVFDTAFHSSMPEYARVFAGPYEWYEKYGIQRYGFHGISHKYCSMRTAQILNQDLNQLCMITCHLGSGASLAAIKNGTSIMTTMGYTPLDGLIMKTRSGSLDPGILIHLLQKEIYSADELNYALNEESGLKGIAGLSGDMREILALASTESRAKLALDMYVNSAASHIASLIPSLGRLDGLVFAGGIGENSSIVRSLICKQLEFLGLLLDDEKNRNPSSDIEISTTQSKIKCLVVHTNEELLIAQECTHLVNQGD